MYIPWAMARGPRGELKAKEKNGSFFSSQPVTLSNYFFFNRQSSSFAHYPWQQARTTDIFKLTKYDSHSLSDPQHIIRYSWFKHLEYELVEPFQMCAKVEGKVFFFFCCWPILAEEKSSIAQGSGNKYVRWCKYNKGPSATIRPVLLAPFHLFFSGPFK